MNLGGAYTLCIELNAEEYLLGGMGSGIRGATQGRHHRTFEPKEIEKKVYIHNIIIVYLLEAYRWPQLF